MRDSVSVVGLGKLGLCFAAVLAEAGFLTIGVDTNEETVSLVNAGQSPLNEPGLDDLIGEVGGKRLTATSSHRKAIDHTDVTFILVNTPSETDGSFSNRYVESALVSLAAALKGASKSHHIFVISSTVMPGSTVGSFIPLLEKHSGRRLNEGFGVCFDPDFVALGEVLRGFRQPELVIIGESSSEAGEKVERIHRSICRGGPRIARMSLNNAEIAKVSLNAFITVKISFANMLANICENVPGTDVDEITTAIGVDRRISPYYLRGGPAYGGTCFPRDTRAFLALGQQYGYDAALIRAAEEINAFQHEHLAELVLSAAERAPGSKVGVLGLSFKSRTPVITESHTVRLVERLLQKGLRVIAYDPVAIDNVKAAFAERIDYAQSARECVEKSAIVVLGNHHAEYLQAIEEYSGEARKTVVDCWRVIDSAKLSVAVDYLALGRAREARMKRVRVAAA
jgi:UDPglucose 6-dehydrogenase